MRLKILKVWPFWPKGMKYHDQYLADVMSADSVSTVFAFPDFNEPSYQGFVGEDNAGIGYCNISLRYFSVFGKPVPYDFIGFAREIDRLRPDVIHIFGISNFTSLFALVAAWLTGYKGKILFNDHSDPNERRLGVVPSVYRIFFKFVYLFFIRNKFTVITPDNSACDELIRRYGRAISKKLKVFPLGYDSSVFNYKPGLRDKSGVLVIGFAGKIFPPKQLELLINVVGSLPKDSVFVRVVGLNAEKPSPYQASLIKLAEDIAPGRFDFQKFIPTPEELSVFYSSIDLAVYPGSISITTFEANGCGCPVVVYESIDGLDNRVSDGRGKLFSTRQELFLILQEYINVKKTAGIDHFSIAEKSKLYSWQKIKYMYYREYGFELEAG